MANNRIINTRNGWLYETAAHNTPTTFTTIGEGGTFGAGNVIIRVTADAAQFDALAYTVQRTNESGDYEDVYNISLNVPDGRGTTRTDCFHSVSHTHHGVDHTNFQEQYIIDQGHHRSRLLYEQQVEIERTAGSVFDYHGNVLRCVESGNTETKELEEGGMLEGYDLTLTTNRKQWADLGIKPIVGATLTKGGKRYKIQQLLTNDASFELGLMKKQ
jgi:hypothetical protein